MRRSQTLPIFFTFILIVLTYIPLLFVFNNSLKSNSQIVVSPLGVSSGLHISNYIGAWNGLSSYLLNTVIVAGGATILAVLAAALCGYAFAQSKFKGKALLFYAFLGLLMIPWTLTLIPLFLETRNFHIYGTWWGLILPYAAGSQPLLVYLFRVFFEGIPKELYESARMDGCTELQTLLRIVFPLSIPVLLTGVVLVVINVWGDYLWPTIVLPNSHSFTISAGLETFLGSFGNTSAGIGIAYAAEILTMIPMILLVSVSMKYFVRGVTAGSIK